jgi:hypothetical protein
MKMLAPLISQYGKLKFSRKEQKDMEFLVAVLTLFGGLSANHMVTAVALSGLALAALVVHKGKGQ